MNIVVCLGNPGRKYAKTRHNIGFIVGDEIAKRYNFRSGGKKFSSQYSSGRVGGVDCVLIFPQTYMNNSGMAVQQVMSFFKEDHSSLFVIHDEIELPFGDLRIKKGGGHKGHNGLRSIIQETGSADFTRMRFGVGRPDHEDYSVADYVLSNFTAEEMSRFESMFDRACVFLEEFIG